MVRDHGPLSSGSGRGSGSGGGGDAAADKPLGPSAPAWALYGLRCCWRGLRPHARGSSHGPLAVPVVPLWALPGAAEGRAHVLRRGIARRGAPAAVVQRLGEERRLFEALAGRGGGGGGCGGRGGGCGEGGCGSTAEGCSGAAEGGEGAEGEDPHDRGHWVPQRECGCVLWGVLPPPQQAITEV